MQRFIPLLATLAVIAVNAMANILPINGLNTGEVSARHPTGFTPAGWVFGIWSLIYLGLLAYGVYAARAGAGSRVSRLAVPYLVSCIGNMAWIFAWHYELIATSLACMLVILAGLVVAYRRLDREPPASWAERAWVDLPFSLYLGWITVATLANLGALCHALGAWPLGLAMDEWALVTVVGAVALYAVIGTRTGDWLYTAVFAWASLGIALQPAGVSGPVRLAAATGAVVAVALTLLALARGRRHGPAAGA